jgi:pterin-4a-carbinolamine dehydratase
VIKAQNHPTWQNSWSYVTIRELQARKHNQFSAIKTSFAKRQDSENMNISWYLNLDIWVFLRLKFVSKLLTFEKQKVMKFHEKLSRKRWQVINFSPLSSQNSSKAFSNWSFSTDFTSDILKLTSRFKIRTLKLAFSKFQTMIEHES